MSDTSHKNFRIIKYISAVLLPVIIISTALSWYLSEKLRPTLTAELKSLVYSTTDSLYRIEFSTIRTNWITGNASLYDVNIIPDTLVLKRQIARQNGPNNVYNIQVKRLMIRGFHPWTLYRQNKLHINELLFVKPDIIMSNKRLSYNENKPPVPRYNPYGYISKYLAELRVSNINLRDIKFKYINNNNALPVIDSLKNLNISLKDWLIDSTSAKDPKRLYLLKDVVLNLNDYVYATADSMYHIKMKKLEFRASTGRLKINQFGVVPKYSEMDFGKQAGFAKDRFNISLNQIALSGINFPLFLSTQELYAREASIENGFLAVFNNNELPNKGLPKRGMYPQQLLQTLNGLVTIRDLKMNNIDISYAEYDKESMKKGILTFQNSKVNIHNLTNSPKYKKLNPIMKANVQSQFMGKGDLSVNFKFHLTAENGYFNYQGSLKNMDGRVLNKVTRPLGMLQIKSGIIDELSFNIRANENTAKGNLDFKYHNLSVRILERAKNSENLVKKGWISFLANNLIINSGNPDHNGKFVRAKIDYIRAPTASFFSFLYKTLFQGIRHSIGFTAAKEQEIKLQIEKFEKMKADRDERRENREQRKRRSR